MAILDRLRDRLAEPHAVAQPLEEVVDGVHGLVSRTVEGLAIDRAVEAGLETLRLDSGEFVGQFAQQRIHLRRVARALGLQFATQLALGLGSRDDRVDLGLGTTDDGVRGCRVDADLEVGEVDEDVIDVVCAVFDECHQADVVAGERRLALAHESRALADDARGVFE